MQITIDTREPISDTDARILSMLVGGAGLPDDAPGEQPVATYSTDAEGEGEEPVVEPEKPARKATAKKAAAKTPEPEPDPEPDPAAEEPVEEPAEDLIGDEDDMSDEDLLALAVKKATEMVASGDAPKVREALDAAGASRVRELNADNVRDFFQALG